MSIDRGAARGLNTGLAVMTETFTIGKEKQK
jgi:hypothetical protein